MPFQPIDFSNVQPIGQPWARDLVSNISEGYKASQLPQQIARERQKEEIANRLAQLKLNQEPQKFNSDMRAAALAQAIDEASISKQKQMTPLEIEKARLYNQFYADDIRSQMKSREALSILRQNGGAGGGVGGKEESLFQSFIAKDNPKLNPNQVYEASNVLRQGGDTLADGTKLNPLSPAARSSFDRITKYGTTAPIITQNVTAEQADAELPVLSKYINDAITPFGDTFNGYSPAQVMGTFSNKKEDQVKLGRLVAAQQLQSDLAALQNKINSGQATATITKEILDRSEQNIKTRWPRMSNVARLEASRYLTEALRAGLAARKKVAIGASSAFTPSGNKSNRLKFNPQTGGFE